MDDSALSVLLPLFAAVQNALAVPILARKRSEADKEYFIQDWVRDRAEEAGCHITEQGRNSYPDFWFRIGHATIGAEVKSLAHMPRGNAARSDLDFNSTAPSPVVEGIPCTLAFALYRPAVLGENPLDRLVTTVCLADLCFVNADEDFAALNSSVKGFGTYGDGRIRNRRMYRFDHPVTIASRYGVDIRNRATLILPKGLLPSHSAQARGLLLLGEITRWPASQRLVSYEVVVETGELRPELEAVDVRDCEEFEVWG